MDILELSMPPLPEFITVGRSTWQAGMQHFNRTFHVYDLIFCTSGALYMTEEDQAYEITGGQMLVLEPGKKHWGHQPTEMDTHLYWVHFKHDKPVRTVQEDVIAWSRPLRKGTDQDTQPIRQLMYIPKYAQLDMDLLTPILDEMVNLYQMLHLEDALKLHTLLGQLLSRLQKSIQSRKKSSTMLMTDAIAEYLQQHRYEPFRANMLEEQFHFNQDYLIRCFKKHRGMTPLQYVQSLRVAEAKHLLANTTLPVDTIAEKVGVSDYNYFIRMFRTSTGLTPGKYRKKMQGYV
ncbi:hypothetical protein A8709_07390 [Paenibacillus pectinilyticus]|uniref:HTH araC/xylS-type domain-containing protein n=1 Tax=Paenibacillus pectinilyticus TaxID=512399 RepID=A0A1C0ZTS0_9BACL|nr:AraC family transcriptional regulator [Paenibacillus pectinilyticus]OCT11484.1 hypothetical protein A8709_07390 [Paenibacillus pectinilyticus]